MGTGHHDIDMHEHIKEAEKSKDTHSIVTSMFNGLKNMVKKGLNILNSKSSK